MKTVLLVEDDKAILEALQMVLETYGFSVVCIQNGKEALEWLKSCAELPRVVLLDLMMPVMDGFGFLEVLKRDPKLAKIPVMVMSARSNFQESIKEGTVAC